MEIPLPCGEGLENSSASPAEERMSRAGTPAKILKLIKSRPTAVWRTARAAALFVLTHRLRRLVPPPGVKFGANVRLQRYSSVLAECPHALIEIGANAVIYEDSRLEAYRRGVIMVGEASILGGARILCRKRVTIGRRVLMSWNVFMQDYDPHPMCPACRADQVELMAADFHPRLELSACSSRRTERWTGINQQADEIEIGDDVWLGANSIILKGAHIGDGCIVAAGAVVTKGSYRPGSIIAGNPARVVKHIEPCGRHNEASAG